MQSQPDRLITGLGLLVAASLFLAACNLPGMQATPESDSLATAAAETVAAELTQAATEAAQTPATDTPPPATATPAAADTPAESTDTPSPTGCTDRADFVTDVTVPDNTFFEAGESFTKTWRLRNAGSCTWTTQYSLVFDSGRAMSGPASVPLPGSAPPNATMDLSVDLIAPTTDGTHRGNWMLRNADGEEFGIGSNAQTAFWVQIRVGPTPTPEPDVYNSGKVDIDQSFLADLDSIAQTSSGADIWFEAVTSTEKYLTPRNGASLGLMSSVPTHSDCASASLESDRVSLDDFGEGDLFCFETNEGRFGRFEVENITGGSSQTITLDVLTWEK